MPARWAISAFIAVLIGVTSTALAQTDPTGKPQRTLQGELVDPATYLKDGRHAPDMESETYDAVDGGQTLALLEDSSQTLYLLLAAQPGEDPNELAYDHANRRVKITGTIYERAGLHGIVPTAVEPLEPPKETPAASSN